MDAVKASGYFISYCNGNIGYDPYVNQERFHKGLQIIHNSSPWRFEHCHSAQDVLREIGWPDLE